LLICLPLPQGHLRLHLIQAAEAKEKNVVISVDYYIYGMISKLTSKKIEQYTFITAQNYKKFVKSGSTVLVFLRKTYPRYMSKQRY